MYLLAVIEPAGRRVRVLGATAQPTAVWVTQTARNPVLDLEETGYRAKYLIRDRDDKFPATFDEVLTDAGITLETQWRPHAPDESDHGAWGADLPARAAGPDADLKSRRLPSLHPAPTDSARLPSGVRACRP
jgi:hypothetical protein